MFPTDLVERAEGLLNLCRARGCKIVSAESCTGGLVGGLLTSIAGSSDVYERGFITYSNEAKRDCLGVPEIMLAKFGAVSEEVARAMAEGALARSNAQIAISITGIAGPGGGSRDKPVGLVHFACGRQNTIITHAERFGELGRNEVRRLSVETALELLRAAVQVVP